MPSSHAREGEAATLLALLSWCRTPMHRHCQQSQHQQRPSLSGLHWRLLVLGGGGSSLSFRWPRISTAYAITFVLLLVLLHLQQWPVCCSHVQCVWQ